MLDVSADVFLSSSVVRGDALLAYEQSETSSDLLRFYTLRTRLS